jgi:hypothetical protein
MRSFERGTPIDLIEFAPSDEQRATKTHGHILFVMKRFGVGELFSAIFLILGKSLDNPEEGEVL